MCKYFISSSKYIESVKADEMDIGYNFVPMCGLQLEWYFFVWWRLLLLLLFFSSKSSFQISDLDLMTLPQITLSGQITLAYIHFSPFTESSEFGFHPFIFHFTDFVVDMATTNGCIAFEKPNTYLHRSKIDVLNSELRIHCHFSHSIDEMRY